MGRLIALGVAAALFIIFIVQNRQDVRFTFLFWHFTWPAWGMLALLFALGLFVGLMVGVVRRHRRRHDRRAERRS
jgi:uncharacterized integral membrane protein